MAKIKELEQRIIKLEERNEELMKIIIGQRSKWCDDIEDYLDGLLEKLVDAADEGLGDLFDKDGNYIGD